MVVMRMRGIKRVKSKGRVYYYHRATGRRIEAEPGSAAFIRLVEIFDGLHSPEPAARDGTLGGLIAAYRASPEFTGLAERTRKDYQKVFDYLQPMRDLPLWQLDTAMVIGVRDRAFKKHKRRFANYTVQVLRLLCSWGKPRSWVEQNPALGAPLLRRPKGMAKANRAWKPHELDAVLAAATPGIRAAVAIGAYAGLREADALKLTWADYDGTAIAVRQGKTGDALHIHAHAALRRLLSATPKKSPIVVTGEGGRPFTESGFRASFFRLLRRLEAEKKIGPDLTFHGLRHTVGTALAEAGCDTATIAAVLGHRSEVMARHYSQEATRKRSTTAAIRKLERNKSGTGLENRADKDGKPAKRGRAK